MQQKPENSHSSMGFSQIVPNFPLRIHAAETVYKEDDHISFITVRPDINMLVIGSDTRSSTYLGDEFVSGRPVWKYDDDFRKITIVPSLNAAVILSGQNSFAGKTMQEIVSGHSWTDILHFEQYLLSFLSGCVTGTCTYAICSFDNAYEPYHYKTFNISNNGTAVNCSVRCPDDLGPWRDGEMWAMCCFDNIIKEKSHICCDVRDSTYDIINSMISSGRKIKNTDRMTVGGHPEVWYCSKNDIWRQYIRCPGNGGK